EALEGILKSHAPLDPHCSPRSYGEKREEDIEKNNFPTAHGVGNAFVKFNEDKPKKLLARLLATPVNDYLERSGTDCMSNIIHNEVDGESSEEAHELKTQTPVLPGANVYSCQYCSRQFKQAWGLKEHTAKQAPHQEEYYAAEVGLIENLITQGIVPLSNYCSPFSVDMITSDIIAKFGTVTYYVKGN
ncbi:zinc finger, C2H2 type, partial [Opisthorchis viverrini]